MHPILRVNVQNQMYFEDLHLIDMFRVTETSRYLFLEFIKSFSLIVVANQGSYDLHIFRLTTTLKQTGKSSKANDNRVKLQREYVFKCSKPSVKILGVSVIE